MQLIDVISFIGDDLYCHQTPEALLQEMQLNNVTHTFIAPSEKYTTVYNHEGNKMISEICRRWPEYFTGYAVCNPWFGKQAEEELRRALNEGLGAVYFNSSIQGFTISDDIVLPLISICQEYRVPVYFHTGTPAFALPFQLHFLAERFPSVPFIMGHSGANDFTGDAVPALYNCPNIWLDTSLNLTITCRSFLDSVPDRVVFGSASPRSTLEYEIKRCRMAVKNEAEKEALFSGNLQKLLHFSI